jgi:hypothetical protein
VHHLSALVGQLKHLDRADPRELASARHGTRISSEDAVYIRIYFAPVGS